MDVDFPNLKACPYLIASMRYHGYPLLRYGHMFDVSKVLSPRLLNTGQYQETIAIWRKDRVWQYVQPFVLRCSLCVNLERL